MGGARAAARTAGFLGYTAATLGAWEVLGLRESRPRPAEVRNRWIRRYVATVLRMLGITPRFLPGMPARPVGPTLVVSNHRSAVDIGVMLAAFGGHILSRADVAGWPLLGRAAREAGTVFVDRGDEHSGASAIRAIKRLLREGETVIVFPEGATFRGDEVRPFRPGAFAAAAGLQVKVIPVGLAYPEGYEFVDMPFARHLRDVAARRRTPLVAHIGEPFAAGRARDTAARAQREVQTLVHLARGELRG